MEAGPLQPKERCFPNFLDQQKGICLFPFCLIVRVLNKIQLKQVTLIVVTSGWQTQSWYPHFLQMSISFDKAKQTKSSVDRKTKLAIPGVDIFTEKLSAEGLSEGSDIIIANDRRPEGLSLRIGLE